MQVPPSGLLAVRQQFENPNSKPARSCSLGEVSHVQAASFTL